jgi:hypothetical protein
MIRRALPLLAVIGSIVFCQAPAAAQDASELKKARAQFQQGTELEQAGNWTAALQAFREVGAVRMTPQVRFHIALCEENLGRLVAALGGYELALGDADNVGPDFKAEVEGNVTKLRSRIPKLVIARGSGAAAAAIELDGVALGDSSIGVEVPLDPGPHAVTAHAPNHRAFSENITVKAGERASVTVELAEIAPVAPAIVDPMSPPGRGTRRVLPLVIGGVGVASLIGSGVLFGLRQSALSDLRAGCGEGGKHCPRSLQSRYDDLKFYHYGAEVTLGVGLAALATGATLLLLERKAEQRPDGGISLRLAPAATIAGPHSFGAIALGGF